MAGLPKRTSLRSSPEDAAYYRQHHDSALSWLRKGIPRAELLQELIRVGVPEKTAERILIAVEQEHALSVAQKGVPQGKGWMIGLAFVVVMGCSTVYIILQMSQDRTLKAKYLIPAGIFALVLSAVVVVRVLFRGRGWLPRSPKPPT